MVYGPGVPYATLFEFQQTGLPSTATSGVSDMTIMEALIVATDQISDSFSSQFTLPLRAINKSITQHCINLAALIILDSVGEAPEGESYKTWKRRADATLEWCRQVREREVHPAFVIDSSSPVNIQPGPQATPLLTPWNPQGLGWPW